MANFRVMIMTDRAKPVTREGGENAEAIVQSWQSRLHVKAYNDDMMRDRYSISLNDKMLFDGTEEELRNRLQFVGSDTE